MQMGKQRPEIVARAHRPPSGPPMPLSRARGFGSARRAASPRLGRLAPAPPYCPGSDGVVLLVDSGTRTAQAARTTAGWCCAAWR